MGIAECGHHACFANKALEHLFILALKHLDGNITLKTWIIPLIDIGHPTTTNELLQFITTEAFALQVYHNMSPALIDWVTAWVCSTSLHWPLPWTVHGAHGLVPLRCTAPLLFCQTSLRLWTGLDLPP